LGLPLRVEVRAGAVIQNARSLYPTLVGVKKKRPQELTPAPFVQTLPAVDALRKLFYTGVINFPDSLKRMGSNEWGFKRPMIEDIH
jgi:hypothetical protein